MGEMIKQLVAEHVTKCFYSDKSVVKVVQDVSFEVAEGEFLVVLGPGHCGKSVLLNIIAGLEDKTSGTVYYNGRPFEGLNPDIAMVFQNLRLLPFLTVLKNVMFGMKFTGRFSKEEMRERAMHYISLVGLEGCENAYPSQLSGGMKQRVGIARAYANNPKILIMDEPFGALDAQTRYAMEEEINKLRDAEKRTVIFVTNNVEEAVYLADKIVLLSEAPATVKQIYEISLPRPRDRTEHRFMEIRSEISGNTDLAI
ncbi:MAG: ABC transporter ATP-binding protein [Clostridiaceae bacterium]|nr:ABC transporter ATP-binding protein [Clostridiaceae bacterium]